MTDVIDLSDSPAPLAPAGAAGDDDIIVLDSGGAPGGGLATRRRRRRPTRPLDDEVTIVEGSEEEEGATPPPSRRRRREERPRGRAGAGGAGRDPDAEMALRLHREEQAAAERASRAAAQRLAHERGVMHGAPPRRGGHFWGGGSGPFASDESDEDVFLSLAGGGGGGSHFLPWAAAPVAGRGRGRGAGAAGGGGGGGAYGGMLGATLRQMHAALGAARDPGGLPLSLAMSDRDFGPDDYETLLRLDERSVARRGATAAELAAHTAVAAAPGGASGAPGADEPCAICLEVPAAGEPLRRLPCLHGFHVACIDRWLQSSRLCPICKHSVGGDQGK